MYKIAYASVYSILPYVLEISIWKFVCDTLCWKLLKFFVSAQHVRKQSNMRFNQIQKHIIVGDVDS